MSQEDSHLILTFKVLHNQILTEKLDKAKQIADWSVKHKGYKSSKDVKNFGLPSAISNQLLRKYGGNKKAKEVSSIILPIPNQAIKREGNKLRITCLDNMLLPFDNEITRGQRVLKVNQIELNTKTAYINCTVQAENFINTEDRFLGVDLNTTGYAAVLANPETGKVKKYNKTEGHYRRHYGDLSKRAQKQRDYKLSRKHQNKKKRKIEDSNNKVSREIIEEAKRSNKGIRLEKLTGIRKGTEKKNKSSNKKFRTAVNNWSFYQLQTMIEYKAKLYGIPLEYVDPEYTSQNCSRCGSRGNRTDKVFKCTSKNCGHFDHADTNAAFNIALRKSDYIKERDRKTSRKNIKQNKLKGTTRLTQPDQSPSERALGEGSTDQPRSTLTGGNGTKEPNSKSRKVQTLVQV